MLRALWRAVPALLIAVAGLAAAQDYPTRPITVVVPFAAGGPTDTLARNLGVVMGPLLKQQIVIDNSAGAGGTIAANKVAKARPDGYTLLLAHIGMSTAPALYRKLPYDTMNDFEFIGQIADVPMTLIANKNIPANTFKEFLAYAKANKDKLNYANAGLGAASHLCGLLFMSAIETDFNTIPYKGTAPAMTDLIGGQVMMFSADFAVTLPQVKAGKIRGLAVTSTKRAAVIPELPTVNEALGLKDYELIAYFAVFAPAGTPPEIIGKLNQAINGAAQNKELQEKFAPIGFAIDPGTPEALAQRSRLETAKWAKAIRDAKIEPQ